MQTAFIFSATAIMFVYADIKKRIRIFTIIILRGRDPGNTLISGPRIIMTLSESVKQDF